MPTAEDFRLQLDALFRLATQKGESSVIVEAGKLHLLVGDYPDSKKNRMPVCCHVMLGQIHTGDKIVHEPPKGKGASLTIRYVLPRTTVRRKK